MSAATYPVHVDAELDPRLSRWLWLVKWLLVLPHYVVLVFLWLAFLVTSVVAMVAILFTGRYPRGIFEFNVGVLRWSWRVAYYAYGALGTDRYPPFSLHEVPDYPAHLEVEYPEHLSRGLVLVKWWLLAIPHYLVVGLLVGGAGYAVRASDDRSGAWGFGLIGLLAVVAGVVLLFTGRYPRELFDLVLGLNRWVLRVAGYVGLMTDRYPPFALDQGGHERGGGTTVALPGEPPAAMGSSVGPAVGPASPPPAAPPGPPPPAHRSPWSAGRVVSLVLGSLLVALSVGLAIPATALVVADHGARDRQGFLMSSSQDFSTTAYAIASTNLEMHVDAPPAFTPESLLGRTRLTARAADGGEVFLGLAPTSRAREYLDSMRHAVLTGMPGGNPTLDVRGTGAPATSPAEAGIWTVQSSGPGTRTLTWTPRAGDWTVVVMNADASPGVTVAARAGAEVPALGHVVTVLAVVAALVLLLGLALIAWPLRAVARHGTRR